MADNSLEFDEDLHQIYSSLEISCLLINEAQIPGGSGLSTSVSNLAGDDKPLLILLDGFDGLAQIGVGIAQVA